MITYKEGDIVVYSSEGLCEIDELTEKKFDGKVIGYYVLRSLYNKNSVTYVPMNNEKSLSKMRHILNREEIMSLIAEMPEEVMPWIKNDRDRQKAFKEILIYGDSKDLVRLTRTLYMHREEQMAKGKKLHLSDERVFKEAEKLIYEEISYVMDIPRDQVLNFITDKMLH